MKVAKLVSITLMTRIVVEDTAKHHEIEEIARNRFINNLETDLSDNIDSIVDDLECPYIAAFNVTYFDETGEVIDTTQIDEKSKKLAWELFKEFGHKKKKGYRIEFEEVEAD